MIYAMSDIHGCMEQLNRKMKLVDLGGDNRIVFLGDYIDYGKASGQVLRYLYHLQQEYGEEKVIVLKGNHEAMLLEWIDDFKKDYEPIMEALSYDSWMKTDSVYGYNTLRTLITDDQLRQLTEMERKASFSELNILAVKMVLETNNDLIRWIRSMKSFYQTDTQIFVHAGVDEDAEEYWEWGTGDEIFLWKFPASLGTFCKTVIAGHVGTGDIARDKAFHDIYYDGASHYYIDGSVYKHGKLLLLGYDDTYYQIEEGRQIPVKPYEKYR
ncbi:MAG: metallophosphoesterase [Lachnospiraceae bacterium]|nr:metallophosphoesterase [Lachnospiraceae bacterium]